MFIMDVWRRRLGEPFSGEESNAPLSEELRALVAISLTMVKEINLLLSVADESLIFNTKVARLSSAKQKMGELKALVVSHPRITITNLADAEVAIAELEREMVDWQYEPNDAWPEWVSREINSIEAQTDYRMGLWRANRDILVGLRFVATMNLGVPLRVLSRHGEIHTDITKTPPEIALNLSEGIWVQKVCSLRCMGIEMDDPPEGMMASAIGPIPTDGGEFLTFLIVVRELVEGREDVDVRAARLYDELNRTFWCKFVSALGGDPAQIVSYFFPYALDTIPGLTTVARDVLSLRGIDTAAKVAIIPDSDLLGIKGIGPAKLKSIREWQIQVVESNATRFDWVTR